MKILIASSQISDDYLSTLELMASYMVDVLISNDIQEVDVQDFEICSFGRYSSNSIGVIDLYIGGDYDEDIQKADDIIKRRFKVSRIETESLGSSRNNWGSEIHSYFIPMSVIESYACYMR